MYSEEYWKKKECKGEKYITEESIGLIVHEE